MSLDYGMTSAHVVLFFVRVILLAPGRQGCEAVFVARGGDSVLVKYVENFRLITFIDKVQSRRGHNGPERE
jgi:hypothetical protein